MIRLITLSDGTGMGDELIIFKTNAPVEELKKLEKNIMPDIFGWW